MVIKALAFSGRATFSTSSIFPPLTTPQTVLSMNDLHTSTIESLASPASSRASCPFQANPTTRHGQFQNDGSIYGYLITSPPLRVNMKYSVAGSILEGKTCT